MQGEGSIEEGTPPSTWQEDGGGNSLNKGSNRWTELER